MTEGLGAGSQPEVGRAAAEEVIDEIRDQLSGAHMVFITAGMGGGTGTGAAPVIARAARDMGILTVGVVTKPFQFEGVRRMRVAEAGINELQQSVDTLIVIPNQNLFRVANEKTTFADAFAMADQVLYSGVACITDLMVKEGLINLDFADVRSIMRGMGKAMMGTGEASGEKRANRAAEAAIANPLLDDVSMKGARGLLISITGGNDLTLYELDEAATRIREEVDQDANIILGATFDESLEGIIRVSVVATGIDQALIAAAPELTATEQRIAEVAERLRAEARARVAQLAPAARRPSRRRASGEAARRPGPCRLRIEAPRVEAAAAGRARRRRADAGAAEAGDGLRAAGDAAAAAEEAPASGGRSSRRRPSAPCAPPRMPRIDELPLPAQTRSAPAAASRTRRRSARAEAHDAAAAPRDRRLRRPQGRDRGARGPGRGAALRSRAVSARTGPAPAHVAGPRGIRQAAGPPQGYRPAQGSARPAGAGWRRRSARSKTISWRSRRSCGARPTEPDKDVSRRCNPRTHPCRGFCLLENVNHFKGLVARRELFRFVTERKKA